MTLTLNEQKELDILHSYKISRTRWMSQDEYDRYKELVKKYFKIDI